MVVTSLLAAAVLPAAPATAQVLVLGVSSALPALRKAATASP